jgi:hypothetical protein
VVNKQSNRLLIVALILGWVFDFLFWEKPLGVNFPIFCTLCLVGGFFVLRAMDLHPERKSLYLLIPFAFFAVITFVRQEPLISFLAYTFTLFSLGVLAVNYLAGNWIQYNLLEYFKRFFRLLGGIFILPLGFIREVREEQREQGETKRTISIVPVLRGLLIAIPIVIFLAALLASADVIFAQKLDEFIDKFDTGEILEDFGRLILILIYAYLIVGTYLFTASHSKYDVEDKPKYKQILSMTETSIVLTSVAILFGSFVGVQFRYFFGGEVNIGVEGYTFSQYARRGFGELITVAVISLLIVLGLNALTKRDRKRQSQLFSGLSIVIVAEVIVILVSSFQRTTLANQWHGYSRLRLYPQIFLIWLGVLFVAIVVLEIFRQEGYFTFAAVIASMGFAVSLSLFNVDATIVKHNVFRATQGKHFNVTHLAMLSTDAVPALVEEFQDETIPTEIHEGIGAALLCHYLDSPDGLPEHWQSFNVSRWNSYEALDEVEAELDAYWATGDKHKLVVHTPVNKRYKCEE